jgi:hypothetical protein
MNRQGVPNDLAAVYRDSPEASKNNAALSH